MAANTKSVSQMLTKNIGKAGIFGLGMEAWNVISVGKGIKNDINNGKSFVGAVAKAGVDYVFYSALGLGAIPYSIVQAGVGAMLANSENTKQVLQDAYHNRNGALGSGHFNMTEAGYTMRQRSLNAIRSNGLNVQSALGNEARTYFGRYNT